MITALPPRLCAILLCLLLAVSACARPEPVVVGSREPYCDAICQLLKMLRQAETPPTTLLAEPVPLQPAEPTVAPRASKSPARAAKSGVPPVAKGADKPSRRHPARRPPAVHTTLARFGPPPLRLRPIVEQQPAQAVLDMPTPETLSSIVRPSLIPGSVSVVPEWFEPPTWR